jgi:tRNA(fMet)-specific endonuclease VapC
VLDTDVCVAILRGRDDVIERRAATDADVVTTWMTAAELMYGAAKSRAPEANRLLAAQFLATLEIVEMNAVAAERFGTIKAELESRGQRLADADLLIAAVTLAHDAILATGNLRHYERIPDLRIETWL